MLMSNEQVQSTDRVKATFDILGSPETSIVRGLCQLESVQEC
jgi:hypothetical protein